MRRLGPNVLPLVLLGAMLLLSLLGGGAGLASFLLLRAGYGFVVWGVLPFAALVLTSLIVCGAAWWVAGGPLPGAGRRGAPEERPRDEEPRREDEI